MDDLFHIPPPAPPPPPPPIDPMAELMQGSVTIRFTPDSQKGKTPYMVFSDPASYRWLRKLLTQLKSIQQWGDIAELQMALDPAGFNHGAPMGGGKQAWYTAVEGIHGQLHKNRANGKPKDVSVQQGKQINILLGKLSAAGGNYKGINQITFV